VYTHIIGRILDENLIYFLITHLRFASNGRLAILLENMKKDAHFRVTVVVTMDGKNKSFIQWFTRQFFVMMLNKNIQTKSFNNVRKIYNVGIIIQRKTAETQH